MMFVYIVEHVYSQYNVAILVFDLSLFLSLMHSHFRCNFSTQRRSRKVAHFIFHRYSIGLAFRWVVTRASATSFNAFNSSLLGWRFENVVCSRFSKFYFLVDGICYFINGFE